MHQAMHQTHAWASLLVNQHSHSHFQTVISSCICPKMLFCAKREESEYNLLPLPKKCYFHSPLYSFRLTMTSQIESSRLTQYTLLYEKGIKKVEIQSMKTTQIKGERKFSFLICALSPSAKSRTLNLYLSLQPNF